MNKPFWMVALLLVIELGVVLLLVPGEWTKRAIDKEAGYVQRSLGDRSLDWIHETAARWYTSAILETRVLEVAHDFLVPSAAQRTRSRGIEDMGKGMFQWWEGRIDAFGKLAYQILARMALALMWLPYICILLVPAVYDGWMTRHIKRTNFDYASPVIHRYSTRGIAAAFCGLIVLFFLPVAIDPIIIPLVMMAIATLVGLSTGNLQKRI